jgi:acetyltransferase-like isoleucine patch superfamily enzyme
VRVIGFVIKAAARFAALVFPNVLATRVAAAKNRLYSEWLRCFLRECGESFSTEAPVCLKGGEYISIGPKFHARARMRLECWDEFMDERFTPSLSIGRNVSFNFNVHIGCIERVVLGNNVLLGSNILITDHCHGTMLPEEINIPPARRRLFSKGPVVIEDDVWIGENVSILPNVTIGKGSIVGANSVVTRSFEPYSVIAGVPAKLIRTWGS